MKYWSKLTLLQKESLLSVIKSFDTPDRHISLEEYNQEIDLALKEIENGDTLPHDEVAKLSENW